MNKDLLIEKYIQNNLSVTEKEQFDSLLESDSAFKEEVLFQKELKEVVKSQDKASFRSFVSELENTYPKSKNKYIFINKKWLIAASIALLVGLTFMLNKSTQSSEQLFNDYFIPYKNVVYPINRGEDTIKQDTKTIAFMAYERGDYDKAVQLFTRLYNESQEAYYLFYKANALLKLNKAQEAIPLLEKHLTTEDTLTAKTNWFLAMAYLRTKDSKKAKLLLSEIVSLKQYNHKKATVLLEKLP